MIRDFRHWPGYRYRMRVAASFSHRFRETRSLIYAEIIIGTLVVRAVRRSPSDSTIETILRIEEVRSKGSVSRRLWIEKIVNQIYIVGERESVAREGPEGGRKADRPRVRSRRSVYSRSVYLPRDVDAGCWESDSK